MFRFPAWLRPAPSTRRRNRSSNAPVAVIASLEDRVLLSNITFRAGNLVLNGSNQGNRMIVRRHGGRVSALIFDGRHVADRLTIGAGRVIGHHARPRRE